MKFIPYLIFVFLWVICVYSPVAHWVWGGGWIDQLGRIDYAGGTVVHITSGISGLVLAIMIGREKTLIKDRHITLLLHLLAQFSFGLGGMDLM